ncbi:CRISPR-associated endonuclease Cas2 [Candidatus Uhrbacteria bacterium]|nr:CRISPR-associated endonuclease Cas2 [Candidatus Uhrbacteria bacterium]
MDNMHVPTKRKLRAAKRHYESVKADEWRRVAYVEQLRRQIQLLETGCTEIYETSYGAGLKLTSRGVAKAIQEQILSTTRTREDGRSCIVSYDIPEDAKRLRNRLRNFLKKAGFVMSQRSIWASEKDVSEKLQQLIAELGLQKWVKIFLV